MSRRKVAAATVVCQTALLSLGIASPASADQLEVEVPDGAASFEILAPGHSDTVRMVLVNDSDDDARLTVRGEHFEDLENGCLRQERQAGDRTCDPSGGELGPWLEATLSHAGRVIWRGPLHDMGEVTAIRQPLAAGARWPVTLELSLPPEAGNETMTDSSGFDLRWTLAADAGRSQTQVLGVGATAPGPADGAAAGDGLPLTGASLGRGIVVAAGALVVGGLALLRVSRVRRKRAVPRHARPRRLRRSPS